MATFEILEGDFAKGYSSYMSEAKSFLMNNGRGGHDIVPAKDLEFLTVATEETVKKAGGTIGWGLAGGAVFGPVGLLAGLVLGKKKKSVTFVARFKSGKKFLAKADERDFATLLMVAP